MKIKKNCAVCGTEFFARKTTQYYCCRKCFQQAYNERKKEERRKKREESHAPFGYFTCSRCQYETPLPYPPKKFPKKFLEWKCPLCNTKKFPDTKNLRKIWPWEHDKHHPDYRPGFYERE